MWHRDLMWHYKMRYMMKQVFLVILLVFGIVAGAQNKIVKKPKKQKPATTHVAPKTHKSQSKSTKGGIVKHVATKASYSNGTLTVNGTKYNMVWVEGGTFRMGATPEHGSDAFDDEKPVHSVTLSSFYIGKTEVTQALWETVMGSNPSEFKGDDLPVDIVSWDDCQEFIRKLNDLTGQNFRLPAEAEWEFACRGGNNSRGYKYSGNNYIDNVAWYTDNSGDKTHPVATKSPNELGIYDMSGNVWEWCSDWKGNYSSGAQVNPKGPCKGVSRVLRGGSWYDDARYCRSSFRHFSGPGFRGKLLGFRLSL